jgi:cytidine deaminase
MAANLHKLAKLAQSRAHAPYSRYNVGAAILTTDGRTFAGCNVENASFPEGWCAETSAIAHMVMDGGGKIAEVAVICDAVDAITPCGGCRQRLSEFGTAATKVHLCDQEGVMETVTLGDLLPRSFSMGEQA